MKEKISPTARNAPEFIPMVEWLGLIGGVKMGMFDKLFGKQKNRKELQPQRRSNQVKKVIIEINENAKYWSYAEVIRNWSLRGYENGTIR